MAHFAEINNSGIVQRVIVVNNQELIENGVEVESKGIDFCKSLFGSDTNWVQTSYNGNFRGRYAGVGMKYDHSTDTFIDDPALIEVQE